MDDDDLIDEVLRYEDEIYNEKTDTSESEEELLKDPSIIYGQLYYSSEKPEISSSGIIVKDQESTEKVPEVQPNNGENNQAQSPPREVIGSATQSTNKCIMCESEDHSSSVCERTTHPNNDEATWRRYKIQMGIVPRPTTYVSCFNCSSSNHGGRDCPDYSRYRTNGRSRSGSSKSTSTNSTNSLYRDIRLY
ncbi:6079_t:CDS:2 [Dentiscutata heterogama]|uniref:6079_t:CDS:1 n=1 Tax=Dentiscutata heterogama TaxID=1316150 RepID=A0ACA9LGC9_9GLOM|nr:6079_t:CDS:2 [Dentiscutata heterogama]